jgi:hypothetical protein
VQNFVDSFIVVLMQSAPDLTGRLACVIIVPVQTHFAYVILALWKSQRCRIDVAGVEAAEPLSLSNPNALRVASAVIVLL